MTSFPACRKQTPIQDSGKLLVRDSINSRSPRVETSAITKEKAGARLSFLNLSQVMVLTSTGQGKSSLENSVG
jgi:hypothetical protein